MSRSLGTFDDLAGVPTMKRSSFSLFLEVLSLGALAFLVSCQFPTEYFFSPNVPPPKQLGKTPLPSNTPVPSPTPVPTFTPTPISCAFAWTNQPLEEETARLQDVLVKNGWGSVQGMLMAYGENCLDVSTNRVVRFTPLQTDFYFTVPLSNLSRQDEMGFWAERLLQVAEQIPREELPGTTRGYMSILFENEEGQVRLWFPIEDGLKALENGLRGSALFLKLQSKP